MNDLLPTMSTPPGPKPGLFKRTVLRGRMYLGLPFMMLAVFTLHLFRPKPFGRSERVALFFRRWAYSIAGKKIPSIVVNQYLFECQSCKKVYQCGKDFVTDIGIVCNVCGRVEPKFSVQPIVLS